MKLKKVIITGGPGTGKTSIIKELKKRGYFCYDEIWDKMYENTLSLLVSRAGKYWISSFDNFGGSSYKYFDYKANNSEREVGKMFSSDLQLDN